MTTPANPDAGPIAIGTRGSFTKTVTETDVVLFAGITGDLHPVHIDEEMMKGTPFGGRLVHGVFVLGLMSTAGAHVTQGLSVPTVSAGYRDVRFRKPVLIGDTITATYTVSEQLPDQSRYLSHVTATNQHAEEVAHALHELKIADRQ